MKLIPKYLDGKVIESDGSVSEYTSAGPTAIVTKYIPTRDGRSVNEIKWFGKGPNPRLYHWPNGEVVAFDTEKEKKDFEAYQRLHRYNDGEMLLMLFMGVPTPTLFVGNYINAGKALYNHFVAPHFSAATGLNLWLDNAELPLNAYDAVYHNRGVGEVWPSLADKYPNATTALNTFIDLGGLKTIPRAYRAYRAYKPRPTTYSGKTGNYTTIDGLPPSYIEKYSLRSEPGREVTVMKMLPQAEGEALYNSIHEMDMQYMQSPEYRTEFLNTIHPKTGKPLTILDYNDFINELKGVKVKYAEDYIKGSREAYKEAYGKDDFDFAMKFPAYENSVVKIIRDPNVAGYTYIDKKGTRISTPRIHQTLMASHLPDSKFAVAAHEWGHGAHSPMYLPKLPMTKLIDEINRTNMLEFLNRNNLNVPVDEAIADARGYLVLKHSSTHTPPSYYFNYLKLAVRYAPTMLSTTILAKTLANQKLNDKK